MGEAGPRTTQGMDEFESTSPRIKPFKLLHSRRRAEGETAWRDTVGQKLAIFNMIERQTRLVQNASSRAQLEKLWSNSALLSSGPEPVHVGCVVILRIFLGRH